MVVCGLATLVGGSGTAAAETRTLSARGLLAEVNAARSERGLAPLSRSAPLTRAARGHSAHLARTGRLSHSSADGRPFQTRLYGAGYPRTKAVGENLAMSAGCSAEVAGAVVDMWLNSPGHRRNLLSKRFRKVGVAAVADGGCSRTVFTADFGG
jgi:uncharacterized protein YkwD